jgi:diguanylate cyclase (GGDEF)-like protein/PAS domain S-box-containing protein
MRAVMMNTRVTRAAAILIVAVLYFLLATVGSAAPSAARETTLVWPAAGFSLAAVLLLGPRLWPAIFAGAFVTSAAAHEPMWVSFAIAAGNTAEALAGAWMLRHAAGFRLSLARLRDAVALLVFGALASTTIGATIGVASLCVSGVEPSGMFGTLWWAWWLSDVGGVLLVTPLLLAWARWSWQDIRVNGALEAAALIISLVITNVIVFSGRVTGGATHYQLEYTVFPFLVWAAIRFGVTGAATANVLTAAIAVWGTIHGVGPYATGPGIEPLRLFQVFMTVASGTGLLLGAAISERNASEARKLGMLDAALDCIVTTDHTGRIVEFNPAAEETFGYRRSEAIGRDMAELIMPEHLRADYRQGLARSAGSGRRFETTAMRADGSEFPVELSITRIPHTNPPMFTGFLRDITEQKQTVNQLAFRATHDGLTDLLNRTTFMSRLNDATRAVGDGSVAVLFVDLDNFKTINDRLGHAIGDRMLVAAARRLRGCVRPGDTLARLGGDEFAILIERVTGDTDVAGVVDRIRRALAQPFSIDHHDLIATASIGVARSSDDLAGPEELLRAADSAMYRAKAAGRHTAQ